MRHNLVATDGSEGANRAIDIAVKLSKEQGRTLSILAVASAPSVEERQQFEQVEGNAADPAQIVAQRNLYQAEQRVHQAGITTAKTKLVRGDPAEAITEAIGHEKADATWSDGAAADSSPVCCSAALRRSCAVSRLAWLS